VVDGFASAVGAHDRDWETVFEVGSFPRTLFRLWRSQ